MSHYLDNSATTRVCEKAAEKALLMMTTKYGNPSSLHKIGIEAEIETERARETIAESMRAEPKNIIFTSGSTESNNTLLLSYAIKKAKGKQRIIVSSVEHPSVLEPAMKLRELGFDVCFAPVDRGGKLILDELNKLLTPDTVFVSVMAVNNETGAIQQSEEIGKLVKAKTDALYHVDAVQAYGKIEVRPKKWNADFVSVSAHKVHGPKGIAALYIAKDSLFTPLFKGGEQQRRLRPGTEASPLIAAFGAAVEEFDLSAQKKAIAELNHYAKKELSSIPGIKINSPDDALRYILNFSAQGIRSETMLHFLEEREVYVSSSSACAKGKRSYVLKAMELPDERIDSAVRVSFSKYNTKDDVDALIQGLKDGMNTLQRIRR